MKTCCSCRCKKSATLEFFPKDSSRKDLLSPRCKDCFSQYRAKNKDRINKKVKELTALNKDKYLVKQIAWRQEHRQEAADRARAWGVTNNGVPEVKQRRAIYGKKWRSENPHKNVAKSVKRRAVKESRTPCWFDQDHAWVIEEAAALAKLRAQMVGGVWHVDHIYPLAGVLVSGLHIMDNIQVVPASFNIKKSNRFNPTVGPMRFLG